MYWSNVRGRILSAKGCIVDAKIQQKYDNDNDDDDFFYENENENENGNDDDEENEDFFVTLQA